MRPMSDLRPGMEEEIWYSPGLRNVNRYAPLALDCTVRVSPVLTSLIVTGALGTTAPEESVTIPARSPVVVVCANAKVAIASASAKRTTVLNMDNLPFLWRDWLGANPAAKRISSSAIVKRFLRATLSLKRA